MARLIDADAMIESVFNTADLGGWIGDTLWQIKRLAVRYINSTPSIDIEPKRGEWVRTFDGNEWFWYCSNCKSQWYEDDLWMGGNEFPTFCPNCGADMREREGE